MEKAMKEGNNGTEPDNQQQLRKLRPLQILNLENNRIDTPTNSTVINEVALDEMKKSVGALDTNITKNVIEAVGAPSSDVKETISATITEAVHSMKVALVEVQKSVLALDEKMTTTVIDAVGATKTVDLKFSESAQRMDGIQNNVAELANLIQTKKSSLQDFKERFLTTTFNHLKDN